MKRILITVIVVMEIVVGGVLYLSYFEVMGTSEQDVPQTTQEQQNRIASTDEQNSLALASNSSQLTSSDLGDQPQPQESSIEQSPKEPLTLPSAILTYFDMLPTEVPHESVELTDELATLGRILFYDPRLSANGTISCNTCHLLDQYGVDHLALSLGFMGQPVRRNSPTVYNAALHIDQFWDGRSSSVEEQAKEPILSSAEMGFLSAADVEAALRAIPGYRAYFEAAFPDQVEPITFDNIATAIGAFERRLMTPSRFDRFLDGNWNEFTTDEFRGLGIFVDVGCTDCHQGSLVGGQLYKKLGEVEPYPTDDLGRYEVTRSEADRYVFKVPSLRNVTETAPYLHDGSISTLPEMVELMARHQLGKTLDAQQISDIVSFLGTLTGEIPHRYIEKPPLP